MQPSFSDQASSWWDPKGLLHSLHLVRLSFLIPYLKNTFSSAHSSLPLKDITILDFGCGGGLLCEPLARLGAIVTGVDKSQELISVASEHQQTFSPLHPITYQVASHPNTITPRNKTFNIVMALDVLEHTDNPKDYLRTLGKRVSKGGHLILSGPNRTIPSYLGVIVAMEYLFQRLPVGTHQWKTFLKPSEIINLLEPLHFKPRAARGVSFSLKDRTLCLSHKTNIHYILCTKHTPS